MRPRTAKHSTLAHSTNEEERDTGRLAQHAAELARVAPALLATVADLLKSLDKAEAVAETADPSVIPQAFIDALRRPKHSRRRTTVLRVGGCRVSIILNPRGRAEPRYEAALWGCVRELVYQHSTGATG